MACTTEICIAGMGLAILAVITIVRTLLFTFYWRVDEALYKVAVVQWLTVVS